MSKKDVTVSDYAQELISVPKAHLRLELRQDESGLALYHDGRSLVECPLTQEGMVAAGFMSQALGAKVPPLGGSIQVKASTGVLYRAIAVAGLDFGNQESLDLLTRLLEEADEQRGATSAGV